VLLDAQRIVVGGRQRRIARHHRHAQPVHIEIGRQHQHGQPVVEAGVGIEPDLVHVLVFLEGRACSGSQRQGLFARQVEGHVVAFTG
jgi:hypothetical protein